MIAYLVFVSITTGNTFTKCLCRVAWPRPVFALLDAIVSVLPSTIRCAAQTVKPIPTLVSWS